MKAPKTVGLLSFLRYDHVIQNTCTIFLRPNYETKSSVRSPRASCDLFAVYAERHLADPVVGRGELSGDDVDDPRLLHGLQVLPL